jgi:SAM-dependent methyltransferase
MEVCLNKSFIRYGLDNKKKEHIKLSYNKGVFKPTETTKFLLDAVIKNFPKRKVKVLDLGCGNGVVGIYLLKKYKNISHMTFADVSKKAIFNCQKNCQLNKISKKKIHFIKSYVFDKIKGFKFDVIVNDISGISYKIAKISDWFKNIPCETGDDGTKLTLNVLKNFKLFLTPNGDMFLPIISLSDEKKIYRFLKKNKVKSKMLSINKWPIPQSMYKHKSMMKKLKNSKNISYDSKYGLIIANTKIFHITLK